MVEKEKIIEHESGKVRNLEKAEKEKTKDCKMKYIDREG